MYLEEGERTMGVWLPLAMAEMVAWLKVIVRMLANDATRAKVQIGEVSEQFRAWGLPLMAKAAEADEKRNEERARQNRRESMMDDLMSIARQFGAKVEEA